MPIRKMPLQTLYGIDDLYVAVWAHRKDYNNQLEINVLPFLTHVEKSTMQFPKQSLRLVRNVRKHTNQVSSLFSHRIFCTSTLLAPVEATMRRNKEQLQALEQC